MINYRLMGYGLLLAAVPASSQEKTSAQKNWTNVVVILTDDMGYADLNCYGNTLTQTPNLNRMAAEGMMLTDFYSTSNLSSPSRAALLTGCYSPRASVPKVYLVSDKGLSYEVETIAECLKEEDYDTALIGKWHLGDKKEFLPMNHGFDYFYGLPYSHDIFDHGVQPFYENGRVIETNPDKNQLTTRYTEKAVDYIGEHKDRPFFLYLCHNMPHTPLGVSDKFRGRSGSTLYQDVLMEIDWSVGEVLKALEDNGISENTLVLFTSDNGPSLKQGINSGCAGEFREGKGTTFEGGHRVPGIFYMPGTIAPGQKFTDIASHLDFFPTVMEMTGHDLPPYQIDGYSMWKLLQGKSDSFARKDFFYYKDSELQAYRTGNIKVHKPHKYRCNDLTKAPNEKGTYKITSRDEPASVYDLSVDKGEKNNLIEVFTGNINEIYKAMDRFNDALQQHKFEPEQIAKPVPAESK